LGNLKEGNLEDLSADGRTTLKWISEAEREDVD
jgi:hypothetical protein